MGKYEEALERAKELHEAGNALTKLQMEIVFPVLKESEDERIICNIKKAAELYWSDEPLNEILSWLEKQKEQKPTNSEKPKEWSKEDEAFLKAAIAVCNRYSHKDIADWLKSLRPNHWKPSKEQMAALEASYSVLKAHDIWDEDEHLPLLLSLCDDLKKL